jgi:hypothetical protein
VRTLLQRRAIFMLLDSVGCAVSVEDRCPFEDDMAPLRGDAIAGLRSIFEDAPAEVEALAAHRVRGVADELQFTTCSRARSSQSSRDYI